MQWIADDKDRTKAVLKDEDAWFDTSSFSIANRVV